MHESLQSTSATLPSQICPHTCQDALNLGKLPLLVAQWAGAACLEPALDAVQVEHVTTATPGNRQSGMLSVT